MLEHNNTGDTKKLRYTYTHIYISSIRGQPNLPAQMFHNSFQASNNQEKTQLFNDYFYSIFSTDNDTPATVPPTYTSANTLHDIEVIDTEVLTILTVLLLYLKIRNNNKSNNNTATISKQEITECAPVRRVPITS